MTSSLTVWVRIALAASISCLIAYFFTPPIKRFAEQVGAIDKPNAPRRINDHPIPRMGGLAIFMGFVLSLLVVVDMNTQVMGMLLGAVIIAFSGALDDIVGLNAWQKLAIQVLAAIVAIRCGIVFNVITSPRILFGTTYLPIGYLSIPLTILWIVGCTNAVNLIDGLDGLAVGVSSISSLTMLIVALFVSEPNIAVILAALTGACVGFMPYNFNPAKIFMGDVGSQFLGYVLATVSIMGLFKFHAIITFLVPVLSMAVPLADTIFAFFRRILHGQSPFHADRGHIHHRLLALGFNQKQAVALLYGVSAILGLIAVLLTDSNRAVRTACLITAVAVSVIVWVLVFRKSVDKDAENEDKKAEENDTQISREESSEDCENKK